MVKALVIDRTRCTTRSAVSLIVLVGALLLVYWHSRAFTGHAFLDARVYADALRHFSRGESPYFLPGELPFIYPPIFLIVAHWLARLLTPALGWKLYLLAHMASVLGVPFVLRRFYLRSMGNVEAFALYLLTPGLAAEVVFFAGNIASLFYFAALLAAVPGLSDNRWYWFYVVTGLASATKISFLVLLLMPLFAGTGQFVASGITAAATFAMYFAQRLWAPQLYQQFQAALTRMTFTYRNYGEAPFGMTANLLSRFHVQGFALPGIVQAIFAGTICWVLWRLRGERNARDEAWLSLIIIAIVLVNPRMEVYDETTALLPAYFLFLSNYRLWLSWILAAVSFAGFLIGHGAIGQLFILTSAFIVGGITLRGRANLA